MVEPMGMGCPRCQEALRNLQSPLVPFHACSQCGGVWLDMASTDRVLQADGLETVTLIERVSARAPHRPDTAASQLPCPACTQPMEPVQIPETNVIVDVCRTHGWWFDRDELQSTVAARGAAPVQTPSASGAPPKKRKKRREGVSGAAVAGVAVAGVAVAGAAVLASQPGSRSRWDDESVGDAIEVGAEVALEGGEVLVDLAEVVAESSGFWEGLGDVLGGVVEVLGALSD